MPAHNGPSGPTMVRSIFCAEANAASLSISIAGMGTFSASSAMPALPGAQKSLVTRGLWAIFQASACSRPPLPIIRILMASSGVTVGEEFRDGQSQKPWPVTTWRTSELRGGRASYASVSNKSVMVLTLCRNSKNQYALCRKKTERLLSKLVAKAMAVMDFPSERANMKDGRLYVKLGGLVISGGITRPKTTFHKSLARALFHLVLSALALFLDR